MLPAPRNFSWLVYGMLAGLARPSSRGDIEYLLNEGVGHIISLTELPLSSYISTDGLDMTFTHIPIQDMMPPTLEQVKEFLNVVEQQNINGKVREIYSVSVLMNHRRPKLTVRG